MPEGFVYVYDLPAKFNTDLTDLPTIWHPEQYDIDQVAPGTGFNMSVCFACQGGPSVHSMLVSRPHTVVVQQTY